MSVQPGEAPWLAIARGYLGVAEIPGKDSAPIIVGWLKRLRAWWSEDSTPWCGTFAAECLTEAGIVPPRAWYRAKAYLDWGMALRTPVPGCIVVYDRAGGGHVGFAIARTAAGEILTLGGNQGDRVSIAPFPAARVLGYRWPWDGLRFPHSLWLPLEAAGGATPSDA